MGQVRATSGLRLVLAIARVWVHWTDVACARASKTVVSSDVDGLIKAQ